MRESAETGGGLDVTTVVRAGIAEFLPRKSKKGGGQDPRLIMSNDVAFMSQSTRRSIHFPKISLYGVKYLILWGGNLTLWGDPQKIRSYAGPDTLTRTLTLRN